jgi:hypothetical protein
VDNTGVARPVRDNLASGGRKRDEPKGICTIRESGHPI